MSSRIDNWIKGLINELVKVNGKEPSFQELIQDCIYLKGIDTAEFLYHPLKDAWLRCGLDNQYFKQIYFDLFGESRDYYYTEITNFLIEENEAEFKAQRLESDKDYVFNQNNSKNFNQ